MGEPTRRARLTAKADDEENLPIDRDSGIRAFKFMEFECGMDLLCLVSVTVGRAAGLPFKKTKKRYGRYDVHIVLTPIYPVRRKILPSVRKQKNRPSTPSCSLPSLLAEMFQMMNNPPFKLCRIGSLANRIDSLICS